MNKWDILEIEATEDIAIIKKAYAKKLKLHHPEDDPQGYQNLREAYDAAIQSAKYRIKDEYTAPEEDIERYSVQEDDLNLNAVRAFAFFIEEDSVDTLEELNSQFMKEIGELYADFFSRIDIQNWVNLFDNEVIWNIYNRQNIGCQMLEFLWEHRNLPRDIWIFLEFNFNWRSENVYGEERYEEIINYIKEKVQNAGGTGYYFKKSERLIDYDSYIEYREIAYSAAERKDFSNVYINLKKAKDIYPSDPDILLIEGKCLSYRRNDSLALRAFNDLLAQIPNHIEGLLCRADIYMKKEKYNLAINDFKKIESCYTDNKEFFFQMAFCYKKLKDYQLSKEYVLKVLNIDRSHKKSIVLMQEISKCMLRRLRFKILINPISTNEWGDYRRLRKETQRFEKSYMTKQSKFIMIIKFLLVTALLLVGLAGALYAHLSLIFLIILFSKIGKYFHKSKDV